MSASCVPTSAAARPGPTWTRSWLALLEGEAGLRLSRQGNRIDVVIVAALTDEMKSFIRKHREPILAELRTREEQTLTRRCLGAPTARGPS